jgi:hypothetical protein
VLTQRERPSYDPDESAHMILHWAAGPSLAEAVRKDDGELPEEASFAQKVRVPHPRSMFSVEELNRRPTRDPDYKSESLALVALAQEMAVSAESPESRRRESVISAPITI